jgi:hypothetical protein
MGFSSIQDDVHCNSGGLAVHPTGGGKIKSRENHVCGFLVVKL